MLLGLLLCVVACSASWHPVTLMNHGDRARNEYELSPLLETGRAIFQSQAPASVRIDFAHELQHIYHRFSHSPRDHTWETTVAHFVCSAILSAERDLLQACPSLPFTCDGLSSLLRACHNRVVPWARDEPWCDKHGHRHFLGRICAASRRKRSNHRSYKTLSELHSIVPHHRSWRKHARAQQEDHHYHNLQKQIRQIPSVPDKPKPTSRRSGPELPASVLAALTLSHRLTLAQMRAYKGNGTSLCVTDESIRSVVQSLYPQAKVHLLAEWDMMRKLLDSDGCDIAVTWLLTAELLYMHPCPLELGSSAVPASMCVDLHPSHYGRHGHRVLHSPGRNKLSVSPSNASLAATLYESQGRNRALACSRLRTYSRLGKYPGETSRHLREACTM